MDTDSHARTELRAELRRVLELLGRLVAAQRGGGRSSATDPLRGLAMEESEAEGLLHDLGASLSRAPAGVIPLPVVSPAAVDLDQETDESPLRRACRVFGLNSLEFDALVLALAVELDQRFARLVAYLNDHIARTRPTVGLVLALAGVDLGAVELCRRPAVRQGLLLLEGEGPLSAMALRVAPEMLPRLVAAADAECLPAGVRLRRGSGHRLDELVIGPGQLAQLNRWADRLRSGEALMPLVVSGAPGSGRATAAQAACVAASRPLVETAWTSEGSDRATRLGVAAREATWQDAALLIRLADGVRDQDLADLWTRLAAWDLPLVLALSPESVEPACALAPASPP